MPSVGQIALDWTVLATVLVVSVAVAVSVALIPAALTARPNLQSLLRQSRTTDPPSRQRALGPLVAVQVALAVVLGIGSVLMLRSLWNLQRVDPGFSPANVLTSRLQTTSEYRDMTSGLAYLEQVRALEREIGIKLALGAHPSTMARSVVVQGVWHAAAGVAWECRSHCCSPVS